MNIYDFLHWVAARWDADSRKEKEKVVIAAMGLMGEAGEVGEHFKKWFRSQKSIPRDQFILEMGDVLHYWVYLCHKADVDPEEIMYANMDKLKARYGVRGVAPVPIEDAPLIGENSCSNG